MDAVADRLATKYGLLLCDPPFTRTDPTSIRAPLFNPGLKENGSIFCHPQGWAVIAEALLRRGDRAYEYCRAYLPAAYNERAEIREIEPYVFCQSAHGRASRRFGASRLPWLTGTATWSYLATTQYILGIRPEYEGLRVDPVIPANWPGFRVERNFRGARYAIEVHNPGGVGHGVSELTCDGVNVDPELPLTPAEPGSVVQVVARVG
jgi:cellobiose phosphorylase